MTFLNSFLLLFSLTRSDQCEDVEDEAYAYNYPSLSLFFFFHFISCGLERTLLLYDEDNAVILRRIYKVSFFSFTGPEAFAYTRTKTLRLLLFLRDRKSVV